MDADSNKLYSRKRVLRRVAKEHVKRRPDASDSPLFIDSLTDLVNTEKAINDRMAAGAMRGAIASQIELGKLQCKEASHLRDNLKTLKSVAKAQNRATNSATSFLDNFEGVMDKYRQDREDHEDGMAVVFDIHGSANETKERLEQLAEEVKQEAMLELLDKRGRERERCRPHWEKRENAR